MSSSLLFGNKISFCLIQLQTRVAELHKGVSKKIKSKKQQRLETDHMTKRLEEESGDREKGKGRAVAAAAQQPSTANAHNLLTHIAT